MLAFVRSRVSDRKLRLFACACCRRVWDLLTDDRCRRAVVVAEAFADGRADAEDLEAARSWSLLARNVSWDATLCAQVAARDAGTAAEVSAPDAGWPARRQAECALLRDILGNPLSPAAIDPDWLAWDDGIVVKLARVIYDERRFEDLPVLADALEEAGCTSAAVLAHCRGAGPHVRGCWLLDTVLGEE
jgi:hypothetical protein